MFDRQHDARIRAAAFEWLRAKVDQFGDVLDMDLLRTGFLLDGQNVALVTRAKGIFKPRQMELPLSIRTVPDGPYDDGFRPDGTLRYRYRGSDPQHSDNVGVRTVGSHGLPLVYFHGIVPGKYLATWPVVVIGDDPVSLSFQVQVDDADHIGLESEDDLRPNVVRDPAEEGRRRYVTSLARRRLHQRTFRERVLRAYREQCAFCRFRHAELLDAAHITPDSDDLGEPLVINGIALCRLHHAAFDRNFLGVRPDYVVQVRPDLLEEHDGPTLIHGIQHMQDQRLYVPRDRNLRPSEDRLAIRYDLFLQAGQAA